ncbi:hypothetical protein Q4E93_20455 [Flavitalea sp. BT771]|uniref:OB-fold protein n=1 Tax=Flavitalea sp. BT771 TaxID=3063329 RepID=UPI0026E38B2A|nr:hypothetical protein [Flavitalea sp. BT771]MDO6432992.1 hypothetical protein [Flavitalea sp. BT771]MDV6221732.1 hypothetical protein [Flavitalea sp. BT771]
MKLLTILLVAAASFCFASCGDTSANSNTQSTASSAQAIQVTATEYDKKYHDNEVAADNLFKDKKVAITGTVESINKDILDDVYVQLTGGEVSMGVQCHLTDGQKAATLKKGAEITIVGTGGGMMATIPQLKDGEIQ